AAQERALRAGEPPGPEGAYGDRSRAGLDLVGDEAEHGGLARAAGPQEDDALALVHVPRNGIERQAPSVALGNLLECDHSPSNVAEGAASLNDRGRPPRPTPVLDAGLAAQALDPCVVLVLELDLGDGVGQVVLDLVELVFVLRLAVGHLEDVVARL